MSSDAPEAAQRLFFALWPEESERLALAHAARKAVRSCGGRPVPPGNIHVTLAFLGSVPQRRVPEVRAIARQVADACTRDAPLALRFETLAHWRKAQILCALARDAPAAAERLARALKDATAAAGFTPDLKPFHAHVTVARKVARPLARRALRPVAWCFAAFALIDSRTEEDGSVYSVIESYPLVKADKARE